MQVPSLGWEDSLEEEIETHSSILAWRIRHVKEEDEECEMGESSRKSEQLGQRPRGRKEGGCDVSEGKKRLEEYKKD